MAITRQQIVDQARRWVGTPFRHQGRALGVAVDCVGLALCVADDLTLVDVQGMHFLRSDYLNYGPQPVGRFVHDECRRRLTQKSLASRIQPGDVLTLRMPTVPCHVAIVTDLLGGFGIVHAYAGLGRVVEHTLDAKWMKRIEGIFNFPGVM